MNVKIEPSWQERLKGEWEKDYFVNLTNFVREEYRTKTIFPPGSKIFAAFDACPFDDVKVVILGQDPYHDVNQANGLCFSVNPGVPMPPSLVNIYQELHEDCGCYIPNNGYLEKWARQGVLMLNTVLTVRAHQANSHRGIGWEKFTDAAIRVLNEQDRAIVFLLWGRPAQMKKRMLNNPNHLILEAPHPSPLSSYRGFFGSKPFSKANDYLKSKGIIKPYVLGGGQEQNIHSGTEATPAIMSFGAAAEEAMDINAHSEYVKTLKNRLVNGIIDIPCVKINSPEDAIPYILNISILGLPSQPIVNFMSEKGISISAGSACKMGHRSPVLTAMGLSPERIDSAVRISLSRFNTEEEIDYFYNYYRNCRNNFSKRIRVC